MTRYVVTLHSRADKDRAIKLIEAAPPRARVEIKSAKRSLPQNDRMWAMLTDVSMQLKWHDMRLKPDDWKLMFLDALKRELRVVPNLDGTGFVNIARSSSDLSREEMSDLIEVMFEFGARHGVQWTDPTPDGPPPIGELA